MPDPQQSPTWLGMIGGALGGGAWREEQRRVDEDRDRRRRIREEYGDGNP